MNILAIDPGVTTGIALKIGESTLTCVCKTPEDVYKLFLDSWKQLDCVVIETFQAQHINKYGLHTVRVVGGIYALSYEYGIECVNHMPQSRYSFMSKSKEFLKGQHATAHEIDALAHLLRCEYDKLSK